MHHAAVIPHQEFVSLPAMFVCEILVYGKRVQFFDPCAAIFIWHAEDVFGMIAEE